jgi:hypothetical protein
MPEAEYVALRRMKVQQLGDDGEPVLVDGRPVLRTLAPGDPIPEAKTWRNLYKEIRAGRVGLAGTGFGGPALADSLRRSPLPGHKPAARKPAAKKKAARKTAKKGGRAAQKAARKRGGGTMSAGEVAVANATGAPQAEGAPRSVSREDLDPEE